MGWVDPTGEIAIAPTLVGIVVGYALDIILDQIEGRVCSCEPQNSSTSPLVPTAIGGGIGLFGPYGLKSKTGSKKRGLAGGGKSGDKTSSFSQGIHAAKRHGLISQKSARRIRLFGRGASHFVPGAGYVYGGYRILRIVKCIR